MKRVTRCNFLNINPRGFPKCQSFAIFKEKRNTWGGKIMIVKDTA